MSELVGMGYAERRPDPADRRVCLVQLAPEGREALQALPDRAVDTFAPGFADWATEDLVPLAQGLRRLGRTLPSTPAPRVATAPPPSAVGTSRSGLDHHHHHHHHLESA